MADSGVKIKTEFGPNNFFTENYFCYNVCSQGLHTLQNNRAKKLQVFRNYGRPEMLMIR